MDRIKVVLYASSVQDYSHQLSSLRSYAKQQNYDVVKEYSENISSAKKIADRQALIELIEFVENNKVDKILIYECNRLSRRIVDFLSIIEHLNEIGVSLYILQNGLETLLPTGEVNPIATLVCGIISQFKASGGKAGRKFGFRKEIEQYRVQYAKELSLLANNRLSLKECYLQTGTSINTLRKIKKLCL